MTLFLALLFAALGVVNGVPGVLPVPASRVVHLGRIIGGAGMIVIALAECWLWWNGWTIITFLQLGLLIFGLGMGLTLTAILRQPCAKA